MKDKKLWIFIAVCGALIILMKVTGFKGLFPEPERPPCKKVSTTPAYLNDLEAYRQHRIKDELEEVEERNGDQFDREAAVKRVMSKSDAQLDTERQQELTSVHNFLRSQHVPEEACADNVPRDR